MWVHRKNGLLPLSVITFVLLACGLTANLAHAATDSSIAPDPVNFDPTREELDLTILRTRQKSTQASVLALGVWQGNFIFTNSFDSNLYLRWMQEVARSSENSEFYDLNLTTAGLWGWNWGMNHLFEIGHDFEPSIGGSFGALYASGEGLGTIINWQRYGLTLELGFQDFLQWQRRLRVNVDIRWSPLGFAYSINTGYSF